MLTPMESSMKVQGNLYRHYQVTLELLREALQHCPEDIAIRLSCRWERSSDEYEGVLLKLAGLLNEKKEEN